MGENRSADHLVMAEDRITFLQRALIQRDAEIQKLERFVRRVAEFDDYTHDDVDEAKILHDLQREAQGLL